MAVCSLERYSTARPALAAYPLGAAVVPLRLLLDEVVLPQRVLG